MADRTIDIAELDEALRGFVMECEVSGQRTRFTRDRREVAILVSRDEYLAMRETIEVSNDLALRDELDQATAELARGALLRPEDLRVE